jgi:CelD/BcsL family acetyltransferase involved in cellulose biosynthesis
MRPAWTDLLTRCERNELTLTPDWLLTWWQVYQQRRQLRIVLFREGDRVVGLAPLLGRRHWYRGVLPFRRLEFLASGEPEGHGICSNHLNVLAERGAEPAVARRLAEALVAGALGPWDEIVLPMMDGDAPMPGQLLAAFRDAGLAAEMVETARAPYLPLPATWDHYLAGLSRGHRRHLTRALRAFEVWAGDTARLERVTNPAELEQGQRLLVDLHHLRWQGQAGVFHSLYFLLFHEAIMRRLLENGGLELLLLHVRGQPVAALYGMAWAGKVCAYQMGRRVDVPGEVSLGVVLLAQAIRRAITTGQREFDFLADDAPYKRQLAPAARPLVQLRAVRPGVLEAARGGMELCLDGVRWCRRALRHRRRTAAAEEAEVSPSPPGPHRVVRTSCAP